jgi:4-aminobutyrate aminotransferase-like enzyme
MMVGVELVSDRAEKTPNVSLMRRLVIGLVRSGLMVKVSWDFRVIIFMPPLNLSEDDLGRALGILEEQLKRVK